MCTGVILEKLKHDLPGERKTPLQTQTAVKEFTCWVPSSASTTQPLHMGVICYIGFQFTVIWDWHVIWRGMTCALAGLTFPPLRIRVDTSWQKALCRSEGHISPERVLRDIAVTRTPQNEARGPFFFFFMVV